MKDKMIKSIVRGLYDLQKLRIMTGNRLTVNFKAKLGQDAGTKEEDLEKEQQKMIKILRASYDKITDGIVEKLKKGRAKIDPMEEDIEQARLNIKERYFIGDAVISTFTEFSLVEQYMRLLANEEQGFARLKHILKDVPIWKFFLLEVKGIGPAMAGVIISEIDIHASEYPSSLWKYAGLDVAQDGKGRSKQKDHLVDIEYADADGVAQTKKSITFNPFLKTKLMGVLASSFLRAGKGGYSDIYYDYKNRLENDPRHADKTKGHRHNMALRYMIKRFLVDLYTAWRKLENLPVADEYSIAKLGIIHKKAS